jgi:carbon storage regulator CsrA
MLILNRRKKQKIFIGTNITIEVLKCHHKEITLGITAPDDLAICRDDMKNGLPRNSNTNPNGFGTISNTRKKSIAGGKRLTG